MAAPSLGIFSPTTLILHQSMTNETPTSFLKRSAIIFDRLVLFPLGLGDMGEPDAMISKEAWLSSFLPDEDRESADLFFDLFLLDRDVIDDLESFYRGLDAADGALWSRETSDIYQKWIEQYVRSKHGDPGDDLRKQRQQWEWLKFYIGNVSHDCKLLNVVERQLADCSGLFSEMHEAATLAVHGVKTRTDTKVLKIAADVSSFDFAQLSWTEIFRLRGTGFVQDFRNRFVSWVTDYTQTKDASAFERELSKLVNDAVYEAVGRTEPDPDKTIWAGILGNLPSPTVLNPIGVASAVNDSRKSLALRRDFGWLYFIQRARKVAQQADAERRKT